MGQMEHGAEGDGGADEAGVGRKPYRIWLRQIWLDHRKPTVAATSSLRRRADQRKRLRPGVTPAVVLTGSERNYPPHRRQCILP